MSPLAPRARRRPVPRGRPGRPALRHRRGQDQARPHQRRRPREPARDPRPGRDVRRAQPVRPGPAHRDRHRRGRDPADRARPRALHSSCPAARPSPPRCWRPWRGGCAAPTRPWPTWSSPTCPAAWPRPCSTCRARFGRPAEDGLLVAHDLTQEELAQLVGASRETVNKALADFAGRGWLRLEARAVRHARRRAAQAPRPLTSPPRRSGPRLRRVSAGSPAAPAR